MFIYNRHCLVKDDGFPMIQWTNIISVKKDDNDESVGDKKSDDLIDIEQVIEDGLDLFTAIGQSFAPPDVNDISSSPLEINQQQIPAHDVVSLV